jgi:RodZ C-terminal domain
MAMVVLVLLGAAALGAGAGAVRRQLIAKRTAAAHHRALDTMGRLVAQHNGRLAAPSEPVDPSHPHVRLVRTGQQPAPTTPPVLRSRPKRGRASAYQRAGRGFDAPPAPPAEAGTSPESAPAAEPLRAAEPAPAAPTWPEPAELIETPPPALPTSAPIAPPIAPPAAPLVFDATADLPPVPPAPPAPPLSTGPANGPVPRTARPVRRRHRQVRSPLRRATRTRRFHVSHRVTAGAAALVIVIGVGAGFLLSRSPGHSAPPARHSSVGQQNAGARPPGKNASSATTIAPAPRAAEVSLVSSSAGYSMFRLSWPATIRLESTGLCWIEIRDSGPTGPVTFQGDLTAGASHAVTGPSWLRLGNPTAVAVTVNGSAITLPLVAGEPYNIQFS